MARKTATYVTCDGPNCNVVAEIFDEAKDAPEGWYHVMPAIQANMGNGANNTNPAFTYRRDVHFEFHQLLCVERWARERRRFQEGTRIPTPLKTNDSILDSITTAFDILHESGLTWIKASELADATNIHTSTVRRYVTEMTSRGLVVTQEAISSKNQPMFLYRKAQIDNGSSTD